MSLFDKFKTHTQNSQNTQNLKKEGINNSFESIENIEYALSPKQTVQKKQIISQQKNTIETRDRQEFCNAIPTYKKVGAYQNEEHLLNELRTYPRLVPCPKDNWHWQDKELCYKKCTNIPKNCIYYNVVYYEVAS